MQIKPEMQCLEHSKNSIMLAILYYYYHYYYYYYLHLLSTRPCAKCSRYNSKWKKVFVLSEQSSQTVVAAGQHSIPGGKPVGSETQSALE